MMFGHNGGPALDARDIPESDLSPKPLFLCEQPGERPDDPKKWPEEYRQRSFVSYLRKHCPAVMAASIANERRTSLNYGVRLKKTGLTPGMPDIVCLWDGGMAFCEFKGFAKDGRAGKLSDSQVEVCNRIHRNGHPVGCFFTAARALEWLSSLGAPVVRRAAA